MNQHRIMVSSITHAIQGREILRQRGIKAYVERTPGGRDRVGCGYSIRVDSNVDMAEEILRASGIKILGRAEGGGHP